MLNGERNQKMSNSAKKIFTVLLLLLCVKSFLSAGSVEERNGKTIINLKLEILPDSSRTNAIARAKYAIVSAFIKKFPEIFKRKYLKKYQDNPDVYGHRSWENIEINLERFTGISIEGSGGSALLMSIAGEMAPDILNVNFNFSDTYIQEGFLYPLDKPEDNYLSALSEKEKAYRFPEKIIPVAYRLKAGEKQKRYWMVPSGGTLVITFLYRKDLLKEAGIPEPDSNWTWDDFLSACKKICNTAPGRYGFRLPKGIKEAYRFSDFLWSGGGKVMTFDKKKNSWQAVYDTKETVVALDFYLKLTSEKWRDKWNTARVGYVYKNTDSIKWDQGDIGFNSTYLDEEMFSTINPDLVGIVPVPRGPGGISSSQINCTMLGLFGGIKDPAVRDAAWEYMNFISSEEADRIRTKILVENGYGAFVNPKYLKMFGYNDVLAMTSPELSQIYDKMLKNGQPAPYGKNCQRFYEYFLKPIKKAQQMYIAGELPKDKDKRQDVLMGILKESVMLVDEQILEIIPAPELRKRRICAILLLIAIATGFFFVFRKIFKDFDKQSAQFSVSEGVWQFKKYKLAYLIVFPAVGLVFFWQYLPLLMGSRMAFQDYNVMGNSTWVGVDNFANLLWDKEWWKTVYNSFRYSFLVISMTFLPPIILAVLLQEIPKGKLLLRTIFYLPAVLSGLVVILLWKSFYDPTAFGVLNHVIMRIPLIVYLVIIAGVLFIIYKFARQLWFHECYWQSSLGYGACLFLIYLSYNALSPLIFREGLPLWKALFLSYDEPFRWLEDPGTAMFCCVLPMVWAGMGPGCLIYLAALKGISDDFYEAADLDGASFIDKIMFVVLPTLKPLLIIQFIGIFVLAWKSSAFILAMTGGESNTTVAGLHIFYKAYMHLSFGPATAMAWVLGFILIGFTMHQLRIISRVEFKAAGAEK